MPGQICAALPSGLAVAQILRVEVVAGSTGAGVAAAGRQACLEAAETRQHAAGHGVLEEEMTRAGGERQHLRDQVEVDGGEESRLLGLAQLVLVEGRVVALYPGILYGRVRKGAD